LTVGDTIGGVYLVYIQPVSRRHLEEKADNKKHQLWELALNETI
jgi:hypothetical protein